jgi:hypothetical protein
MWGRHSCARPGSPAGRPQLGPTQTAPHAASRRPSTRWFCGDVRCMPRASISNRKHSDASCCRVWKFGSTSPSADLGRLMEEPALSDSAVNVRAASTAPHYFFLRMELCGLRLPMLPLSLPASGSITALIRVGLPESIASFTARLSSSGVVTLTPTPPKASIILS